MKNRYCIATHASGEEKLYGSLRDAALHTDIDPASVSRLIRSGNRSMTGYTFRIGTEDDARRLGVTCTDGCTVFGVICKDLETGQYTTYRSVKDAHRLTGIREDYVIKSLSEHCAVRGVRFYAAKAGPEKPHYIQRNTHGKEKE